MFLDFNISADHKIVQSKDINDVVAPFYIFTRTHTSLTRSKFDLRPKGPSGVGKSMVLFGQNGVISKMISGRTAHASIITDLYVCAYPYKWSMVEAFRNKKLSEYEMLANALVGNTTISNVVLSSKKINLATMFGDQHNAIFDALAVSRRQMGNIRSTNNNAQSSRSTLVVKVATTGGGAQSSQNTEISLIDPPGVEDIYKLTDGHQTEEDLLSATNRFIIAPVAYVASKLFLFLSNSQ